MMDFEKERILGLPAAVVTMEEALQAVEDAFNLDKALFIASINPEICIAAQKDDKLFKVISSCGLGIPDGIGIVLASRLKGGKIKERITGIDLMMRLCAWAEGKGKSIYLLGAGKGVAQMAADKLIEKHPGLIVAGTHHGFFAENDEADIAENIKNSGADIVFVGLGSPRQEMFIHRNSHVTGAKALMAVGGSFDVLSGNLKRAPHIWQKLGLEWVYRVILQPKRAKRLLKLPLFLLKVLIERN